MIVQARLYGYTVKDRFASLEWVMGCGYILVANEFSENAKRAVKLHPEEPIMYLVDTQGTETEVGPADVLYLQPDNNIYAKPLSEFEASVKWTGDTDYYIMKENNVERHPAS